MELSWTESLDRVRDVLERWDRRLTETPVKQFLPSLLILLAGSALSLYLFFTIMGWYWDQKASKSTVLSQRFKNQLSTFKHESNRRITALENRFQQDLESLYSLRELFITSDYVSWRNFQRFTRQPLRRHPEITSYYWIPRLPADSANGFLKAFRSSGPRLQLSDGRQRLLTESTNSMIWPIHYATPVKDNEQWIGLDALGHSLFDPALSESLEQNRPISSYSFSAEGGLERNRFMVFLNVDSPGVLAPVGGQRLSYQGGFVGTAFNIELLVSEALSIFERRDLELFIFAPNGQTLIQRGRETQSIERIDQLEAIKQDLPSYTQTINLNGIHWTVVTIPSGGIADLVDSSSRIYREAWAVLIMGLLMSLVTSGYLFSIQREIQKRKEAEEKLRAMARRDPLTDLLNRRTFFERLEEEFDREARYDRPLSLLMIDIDHFKSVNDEYGHPVGDTVLKQVSDLLEEQTRDPDVTGRYGGEEFAIILPETPAQEAIELADRIRDELRDRSFESGDGDTFHVTCSIGVAEKSNLIDTPEQLLEQADDALYQAKNTGRDKTVLHSY